MRRSLVIGLLFLVTACGGSGDSTGPEETLGAFEVEFADEVREFTPVELTVRAVGDLGTTPFTLYDGPVGLSLDTGTIEPATIELVGGIGQTTVMISGAETAPTLTASAEDRSGSLSFAIGRFLTSGTLELISATLNPHATARIRLPNGDIESEQREVYDAGSLTPLFKSIVAEQTHVARDGEGTGRSLAQFNSTVQSDETSLSVHWNTVTSAAALGFDSDLQAEGGAQILGGLRFEVIGEPLVFELDLRTSRQFDKGMSCVAGVSLSHRNAEGQVTAVANVVNGTEIIRGLFEPGIYALNFDTTAIARSEAPKQIVTDLRFDVQLVVSR
jgi:hypothetical protein